MNTRRTIRIIMFFFMALISFRICTTTETAIADVKGKTWDYVIMGSSVGTWWGDIYAGIVKSDLGVEVRNHDYYRGGQPAMNLLINVFNNEELRGDIKEAELVTIGVGFADMYFGAVEEYRNLSLDKKELKLKIINDSQQLEEKVKTFGKTYDSLLDEVLKLASDDTRIRVMDFYFPFVTEYKRLGIYDQTKYYWKSFNECIIRSARDHSIPVAHIFQLYNGTKGDEDPVEKGWIADDGLHPSDKGMEIIATEFRKLGYE